MLKSKISEKLDIPGLLDTQIQKNTFKRMLKTAIKEENESAVKDEMSKYKKMSIMRNEKEKKNAYIKEENIPNARILFKHRCDMYDSKLNFKGIKKYKEENYKCDSCEKEDDDNLHVLYCSSYQELRREKDLENNKDLAEYLLKVMNIRTNLRLTK